jgi:hypothetical protein
MNAQILGLRVAGTIFGAASGAHLLRLATHSEVIIGGYQLPLWPSVAGFVIAGGLCLWLWKLSMSHSNQKIQPHDA